MLRKKVAGLTLPLLFILPVSQLDADDTVHVVAASCRLQYETQDMSVGCLRACANCHTGTPPAAPTGLYTSGDADMCRGCHPDQAKEVGTALFLLNIVGTDGANHPVDIFYDPASSPHKLKNDPLGPLLFYDDSGDNPKVFCSTCHDPMGLEPMLLRVNNAGSALCLKCHDK